MGLIVSALLGSFWVRIALAVTLGLGALKGYGLYERHAGTVAGRAEVTQAVQKKADKDADLSQKVRKAVTEGKRGVPDPSRLRP